MLLYHRELGDRAGTLHFLDDSRLLVASGKRLLLWAVHDGTVLRELTLPDEAAAFVVTPDGSEALVGTPDGAIHTVRLPDLKIKQSRIVLDRASYVRMAISPEGSLLAATTRGGTRVVLLDPHTLESLAHMSAGVTFGFLVFDPKGMYLAFGDCEVILWDLALVREGLAALGLSWDQVPPAAGQVR
jgi:hypothetical protein